MNVERILKQSDYFKGLSEESLRALSHICIPKKIPKRQILFNEGQKGHSIYLLVYGTMQVFKSSPKGREVVIKVINRGELFAEVILFEETHYPASAVALADSMVILLPKHQVHCLLVNEKFRNDFINMLMKKQRHLADRIFYLTAHDVEERFFLFLIDQYGRKPEYSIALSKKDIAAAIDTNPETLSRLLLRLKNERGIIWENKCLTVGKHFWEQWQMDHSSDESEF